MERNKEKDFGDFKEIEGNGQPGQEEEQESPTRIRLPRQNEFIGIVLQRLGGSRMEVKSTDGKTRNCRVPGKFRRKFWLRPRDLVIITPWLQDDKKGDIIYQYNKNAFHQLKKRSLLKSLEESF